VHRQSRFFLSLPPLVVVVVVVVVVVLLLLSFLPLRGRAALAQFGSE
jgi:hypothetical protein